MEFLKKYWYFIIIGLIMAVGACFRMESYFINRQIWYDEALLLENFLMHSSNGDFSWIIKPLKCFQMAPFGYLLSIKILTVFFGTNDYMLRLIPFLASLVSILVFFILSKEFLKTKRAIIFANVLFCTNFLLARYASEFKQYGLDVLVFMAMILLLSKINIEKLTITRALLYGVGFAVLFFISQPSVFLLFGFIVYNLLKNIKNAGRDAILKLLLIPILPLIFIFLYKNSMPENFNQYMNDFWYLGFIRFDTIFGLIKNNIIFFVQQQSYLKFLLPIMVLGFFIFLFKKTAISRILLWAISGMLIASALECYPISERLILFMLPFFIIFTALPFDVEFKKIDKVLSNSMIAFSLIFLILFQFKIICKNRISAIDDISRSRDGIKILMENFSPIDDIIILPVTGVVTFDYYSKQLNFNVDKEKIAAVNFYDDEEFKKWLLDVQNFGSKKYYWIYIPDNYALNKKLYFVKWLKERQKETGFRLHLSDRTTLYKIKFD